MSAARSIRDLPGPRGLPLLGNLHQTWRLGQAHLVVEEWCDRYGPIFKFRVGRRLMVAVSDVDEINRILRERPKGYRRWREIESGFAEIGFPGVFSVEGEDWRRSRRLAVTALNSNHLHRHFHVVRTATERLYRRLGQAAREGRSFDISQEFTSYSVDITSTLAFGHDLNTLERGESELQRHIARTFNMLNFRLFFPIPYWRWLRLPPDRALDRSVVELNRAVAAFVDQARARMRERPELFEEPENFLEAMLATQREDDSFTDQEIVGNTFALLIAGEDTTAHTMAWTSWFLAQRPDIQARWAEEAAVLLDRERFPTDHELIARFSYGEAVLRESMRLKSVANGITVEPLADTTVCDTHIPAGTRLILETRYAGRRASGADYEPARWLDDEHATPDQKTFLSFGAGPRFCPGRNLALLESKSAMAMIARNFEMELDESAGPVRERLSFTMIPAGLRVRLRERVATPPTALSLGEEVEMGA
ncbi:MAG: cytochrome P450 [Solirubrobacteraceae bacterium]